MKTAGELSSLHDMVGRRLSRRSNYEIHPNSLAIAH
jgi:hypothetical protein